MEDYRLLEENARDPSKIDAQILEELICRFLINLPKCEK